jgi:2-C-methyl-D-erythritol 4-phosphate cytidylyltransferase
MKKLNVILLAAGKGKRMGQDTPKQFSRLAGKPLLVHSAEVFQGINYVDKIITTFLREKKEDYLKLVDLYGLSKVQLVEGGERRQESVYNALREVDSERVIIHEAVRPFINKEFVDWLISFKEVAVVPTVQAKPTILEGELYLERILDRGKLKEIQLPQVFNTDILRKAHEKALEDGFLFTEDSALVHRLGYKVRFVKGLEENIKITTPIDMILAEVFDREKQA